MLYLYKHILIHLLIGLYVENVGNCITDYENVLSYFMNSSTKKATSDQRGVSFHNLTRLNGLVARLPAWVLGGVGSRVQSQAGASRGSIPL